MLVMTSIRDFCNQKAKPTCGLQLILLERKFRTGMSCPAHPSERFYITSYLLAELFE